MPGWFDIASLDADRLTMEQDVRGMQESVAYVEGLVSELAKVGVPSHRVVVGGFSQGGAVALLMLRSQLPLAGVLGLSTYLPMHTELPLLSGERASRLAGGRVVAWCWSAPIPLGVCGGVRRADANRATPVLLCHGDADQVVAFEHGQLSFAELRGAGADAEFKPYRSMGHEVCDEELQAVAAFLAARLGGGGSDARL